MLGPGITVICQLSVLQSIRKKKTTIAQKKGQKRILFRELGKRLYLETIIRKRIIEHDCLESRLVKVRKIGVMPNLI